MASSSNAIISSGSINSISQYISYANSIPLLTDSEEKRLLLEFRNGNQLSGKKVAEAHLRVVVRISMEFQKYYSNLWDIISEGNIGLLKALKNFSLEKNVKFVTYANLWIKASIQEFILKSSSMLKINIGSQQKKIMFNLGKVKASLRKIHGENGVTAKRIANVLSVDESEIADITNAMNSNGYSLDVSISDDSSMTVQDVTPSDVANPEESFTQEKVAEEQKAVISKAFTKLNEREKIVIQQRFLAKKTATLLDLSKELKVSVERVRQIEVEALRKMRKAV